jgi:hypothetical protein
MICGCYGLRVSYPEFNNRMAIFVQNTLLSSLSKGYDAE